MKLYSPAPKRPVTSPYGMRKHPISGAWKKHRGTDFGGTFDVLSAGDGVVTKISYNGNKSTGGGHVVVIKHATNLFTVYYHGRERTKLNVGDRVKAGDFVYVSGSTGASTGPHLHWEVRTGSLGQWGTDVDPAPYLAGSAPTPAVPSSGLTVNGRLDKATWRKWQEILKREWGYRGIVDGVPGKMTWAAIQRSGQSFGYTGAVDGVPGPNTRKAVQKRLAKSGFYKGAIDGVWGKGTIGALQNALNANKY